METIKNIKPLEPLETEKTEKFPQRGETVTGTTTDVTDVILDAPKEAKFSFKAKAHEHQSGALMFPENFARMLYNYGIDSPSKEFLNEIKKIQADEKRDVAFVMYKDRLFPNLELSEMIFAISVLVEFVEQSNICETHNANKAISKENLKRKKMKAKSKGVPEGETKAQANFGNMAFQQSLNFDPIPYESAEIGVRSEQLPEDLLNFMKRWAGVTVKDLWLDEKGNSYKEAFDDDNNFAGFICGEEVFYIDKAEKTKEGFTDYICTNKDRTVTKRIYKQKADKVIFINKGEFCRRHFHAGKTNFFYQSFEKILKGLGKKEIPIFKDFQKKALTKQFFNVYEGFINKADGKEYVMIHLIAPDVMEGVERDNYVKLPELYNYTLKDANLVALALLGYCMSVRKKNYKKKSLKGVACEIMTLQELFELTGACGEVEARQLSRYLPKLKEALLLLKKNNILVNFKVSRDGKALKDGEFLHAQKTDTIQIDINLNYTKRTPIAQGEIE